MRNKKKHEKMINENHEKSNLFLFCACRAILKGPNWKYQSCNYFRIRRGGGNALKDGVGEVLQRTKRRTKAFGFHVWDEKDWALASPPAAGAPPQFTLSFLSFSAHSSFFSSRLPGNRSDYSWSLRGYCGGNESLSELQRHSFHVAEEGVEEWVRTDSEAGVPGLLGLPCVFRCFMLYIFQVVGGFQKFPVLKLFQVLHLFHVFSGSVYTRRDPLRLHGVSVFMNLCDAKPYLFGKRHFSEWIFVNALLGRICAKNNIFWICWYHIS